MTWACFHEVACYLVPAALLALGCAPKSSTGESGTGTSSVGDTGGASSSGGGTGGSSGSSTGSSSGSSTAESCEAYEDADGEFPATTVKVTNTGDDPVLVAGISYCESAMLLVEPVAAADNTHWPRGDEESSCKHGCPTCGDDGCMQRPGIMIVPGGTYRLEWDGAMHSPADPPHHCCFEELCADPCYVRGQAPDGEYRATVHVVTEPRCYPADTGTDTGTGGAGATDCDCTPNDDGWCQPEGWEDAMNGSDDLASVTFARPASEVTLGIP